jgi:hypothetical protein
VIVLAGTLLSIGRNQARRAAAAGTPFYRIEAEAMTVVGRAAAVNVTYDPAASGGHAVKAWMNSSGVGGSGAFSASSTYAFIFGGREDYYGGTGGAHAHVSLYLDGATTPAGGVYVTNTTGYRPYTITVPLSVGMHSFQLLFDNDGSGGSSSTDRNAYIDYVTIADSPSPTDPTSSASNTPVPAPATATPVPVAATPLSGTAYYVDCTSGADTNSGTSPTSAWQSLGKANSAPLVPGASLLFKRGCTWTGTLTVSHSGTPSQPIIVGAYGSGALPTLQSNVGGTSIVSLSGSYITVDSLMARAIAPTVEAGCQNNPKGWIEGFTFTSGAQNDTVQNSEATGAWAGVDVQNGAAHNQIVHDQLVDNTMMWPLTPGGNDDAGSFGITLHGDYTVVAHNTISGSHACSYDYGTDGSAVEVYGGQNNVIQDNVAVDDDAFTELGNSRSANNTYAYNLYTSSLSDAIFVNTRGAGESFGPVYGTKVYNNTVYLTGSQSQGFVCFAGCNSQVLTMRNNIVDAAWKAGYADAPFDEDNDLFHGGATQFTMGPHSRVGDPLFVSPSTNNFHLQAGSLALNMGVSLGYTTDLASNPVTSPPAVGSYQG